MGSLALLPLGPLFFPRIYLIVLFLYFTVFLYSQVNHVCQFYQTSRKIKWTIRKWNKKLERAKKQAFANEKTAWHDGTPTGSHRHGSSSGGYSSHEEDEAIVTSTLDEVEEKLQYYQETHYFHAFIIPNYCEPEELLKDTMERIACHSSAASHYGLILAMEESEPGWEGKARRLQQYFSDRFAHFIITSHPSNIPGESRGKGSNVAYAARHGCRELIEQKGIDSRRIIITVSDSDAAIPELYIREVEHALNTAEDPYHVLCAPPIFFSRNCFDVPAAVRVTDITWSAMVMSNLSNSRGMCIPCSNYSLSWVLADEVGYWDTDADAVGEDMHMWLKCFWKTQGLVRTAPIYVPINLTNVQTEGYLSNVNARYVQAKRHYNGVADVAYTLKHAFHGIPSKVSLYERVKVCLIILEAHMVPATSGWLMFAAVPLMQFILFPPLAWIAFVDPSQNPILTSEFYSRLWSLIKLITLCLPLPLFGTLAVYEMLHRMVDREFLHKPKEETRKLSNVVDYVHLPVAAWLFMTLPSTLACIKRLLWQRQEIYITSEKLFRGDKNGLVTERQL
ncbi:glycosyl transferase family group 2-domain-containing protein [Mycotypha africana]|uniref:glycosyl transferase family group 2-domain-containing protein n=1 Tax=Mycotypha africana TaxID=64632 RepID=UPI002301B9FB|nr:glycosyl transferase family group 2-domain-containing protein [Mycotypha africana]KAI8991175.1 glycosyl transferase family group 2-domain-containing protein [Mycotypha africana]